jgi:lipopolysaccharide biosynthesis regulator YciM
MEQNDPDKAILSLTSILDNYEEQKDYSAARFKLGEIYFNKGEIQKASETWKPLKEKNGGFWYKLAQEKLSGADWDGTYKKYVKRIPAMSNPQRDGVKK